MADANINDSTPTPTAPVPAPADPSPAPASPDTSTTDPSPAAEPTLLTPAADPAAPADPAEPAENAALFGVPDGDYEIAVPEGMTVDTEAVKMVEPLARELGLSGEGMNKLVNVYAEQVLPHVTSQVVDGIQKDIVATHAQWATAAAELVRTDPAFAGKPMAEIQQVAAKALDRLGSPELRAFLAETGLGNHPDMVKFAYQAGSAISEDTTFERGGTTPKAKSRTDKYYGAE